MKRGFVDIPEGQVHYRTEGSGEPLLFLHQTALSSNDYIDIIPILAESYRVIAMDTLGYGDSGRPPLQYSIEDYARSVISFLNALGIDRTNIAGHHTGANIASELAAEYPERVIKLVLSGCPCIKQPEEGQAWMNKFSPVELKADGSHLMEVWEKAMERFPETALELAQSFALEYFKAGMGKMSHAGYRAAFTYDAYSRLPLIKSPTLLIVGDQDILYSHTDIAKNLITNNKVKVIRGGTGYILRLMPKEWAQAVLDFLK